MQRWIVAALIVIVSAAAPSPAAARTMPKSFVDLSYPADALAARVTGAVVVRVTTDPSGRVVEAEALSGPAALRPDAVANALRWTLAPGEPTDAIVYRFAIDDGLCNADRNSLFRLARPDLAVITACTGRDRARPSAPRNEVSVEDYGVGQYPPIAQSARVTGIIVLELTIDRRGRVTDVRVLNSAWPLLVDAAIAHVKTWRIHRPAPPRGIIVYEFAEESRWPCKAADGLEFVANDYVRLTACPRPLDISSSSAARSAR